MEETIILDGIRAICAALDRFIYGTFIPMFYEFIVKLAELNPFNEMAVQDFATRMYSLLALFMLFKISFSFITYIVNPDEMVDKTKGAGSIVKNVIIVLILIIICPRAFSLLREAQSAILNDQILPKFILGTDMADTNSAITLQYYDNSNGYCENADGRMTAKSTGHYISLMVLRNFYNIDYDSYSGDELESTEFCYVNEVTANNLLSSKKIYNLAPGVNANYVMDYWIIISTVVGVVVALILLSFCFDVAVRSIKLGFLEIIAPIPIISYLDPNSGKNGMFKKWLSEVGKTWASLFIRLAAIFFAIFVISQLNEALKIGGEEDYGFFIELFFLIGALMFAKQLPNLIEKITGLNMKGSFELNPFKKVANEAMGGKLLVGGAAAAAGAGIGLTAYAGKKITDNIKNGSKNRLDNAEKRLNIASQRYTKDPSDRNLNNYKKAINRFNKAHDKNEKHEARSQFIKDAKASVADKLNWEDVKLGKVYGAANTIKTGVIQAKDAAIEGYNQGKGLKFKPHDIGEKSSKQRDYKENYGLGDRVMDKWTDFIGMKNDSGTTNLISEEIKRQNEILERINQNIATATRSFSDLQSRMGSIEVQEAITWNADGTWTIKDDYDKEGEKFRPELEAMRSRLEALNQQREEAEKAKKRQESMKNKKPGKP